LDGRNDTAINHNPLIFHRRRDRANTRSTHLLYLSKVMPEFDEHARPGTSAAATALRGSMDRISAADDAGRRPAGAAAARPVRPARVG
jgi:hypothetical protein